jgi:hypothetical protein
MIWYRTSTHVTLVFTLINHRVYCDIADFSYLDWQGIKMEKAKKTEWGKDL